MTYLVVEFVDEGSVAVISTMWRTGPDYCLWPAAPPKKFEQLVKSHCDPNTTKTTTWTEFKCKVISETADYDVAERRVERAKYSYNVDSSTPKSSKQVIKARHSRFVPVRSQSRITSGPIPNVKKQTVDKNNTTSRTYHSLSLSSSSDEGNNQDNLSFPPPGTPFLQHLTSTGTFGPQEVIVQPDGEQETNEAPISFSGSVPNEVCELLQKLFDRQARFEESMLRKLRGIEEDLRELLRRSADVNPCVPKNKEWKLPLTTISELDDLVLRIQNENKKDSLVNQLTVIGGGSKVEITHRVLDDLFTEELALQITFSGKGKEVKAGLKGTLLLKTIFEAVRKTRGGEGATNKEIEDFFMSWRKNIYDKVVIRKRREPCQNAPNPSGSHEEQNSAGLQNT